MMNSKKLGEVLKKHYDAKAIENIMNSPNPLLGLLFTLSDKDKWICDKLEVEISSSTQLKKLKRTKKYKELSAKYDELEAFL